MYAVIPAVIAGGGFEGVFKLSSGEPLHLHFLAPILAPLSLYSRHAAVAEAQRLGLEVLLVVCAFVGPPLTSVGQPTEALVVLTVLLLSELLGAGAGVGVGVGVGVGSCCSPSSSVN